jgi:hypothetical protein
MVIRERRAVGRAQRCSAAHAVNNRLPAFAFKACTQAKLGKRVPEGKVGSQRHAEQQLGDGRAQRRFPGFVRADNHVEIEC